MIKKKVIAIFDIGRTNKKILLFNEDLKIAYQQEKEFETAFDEDGFECDDLDLIEAWIKSSLSELIANSKFDIVGVNFCTYGASLVFLDEQENRLTPLYNYLKKIPDTIYSSLFQKYGGKVEFCRKTASPSLGLFLNAGVQLLWLKQQRPEVFKKLKWILHFPQFLSFLLTGKVYAESTSIGCHTFMWDFDDNCYHQWLNDAGISMPDPISNSYSIPIEFSEKEMEVGIGIHDSSSALVPYFHVSKNKFILISTGTWCIIMNPFNHSPLTKNELKNGCLAYLNIDQQPIKSSRFFLGHIHDVNLKRLREWFTLDEEHTKDISANETLLKSYFEGKRQAAKFFTDGIPDGYIDNSIDLSQFNNFSDAYHCLMYSLVLRNAESINLISMSDEKINQFYVSGGFARNEIYLRLLATFFPEKEIFTSEVDNASALGATLVIWHAMGSKHKPKIKLNLCRWDAIN